MRILLCFLAVQTLFAASPSSVTLLTSANPSDLGSVVTLIANVTPAAATGFVTFYDGEMILGTQRLTSGQAGLTSLLASGTRSIRAYYGGDSTYAPSSSLVLKQTVVAAVANGFQPPEIWGPYAGPFVTADFNGDGIPDLAVAYSDKMGSGGVSVLLGNGDGTFQPPLENSLRINYPFVTAGDFNGDGVVDLAVAFQTPTGNVPNEFTILLGNGDGTFGTGMTYPLIDGPASIAVADINGDGKADLAIGGFGVNDSGNDNLSIFLGNGDGTFQAAENLTLGLYALAIAVGDFNGDGNADLAVGTNHVSTMYVLLGNGDGTFQPPITFTVSFDDPITGVATADFDGDGKADLAVTTFGTIGSETLVVYLGNGDGTFKATQTFTPNDAVNLVVGDFNGDGKPDLAVGNGPETNTSGGLSIFLGNGDGTFQPAIVYPMVFGLGSEVIADFNGDGKTDLAAATSGGIDVMLGQLGPLPQTITFSPPANVPATAAPFAIAATASSGLPITFASSTPKFCTISGNIVTVYISGGCTITATQPGNANYAAAAPVTQSFTVLYADVPSTAYYFNAVNLMAQYGVTAGCGSNHFCPDENVSRAEMAILLVSAIEGGNSFTYSPAPHFSDVQPSDFGFKWIQALYELGITAGCGGGNYCPNDPLTRDAMAVFIISARFGAKTAFTIPSQPYFTDVPATDPAFRFVQRLKRDAITGGCTATTFCPGDQVTRGQMAVFIMSGLFNQNLPTYISQISPSTLTVGTSTTITIFGKSTDFAPTTTLLPIPGVTIGTITLINSTLLTVQLTAADTAAPGPRSITATAPIIATDGNEMDALPNGLTIVP
jgi:Bacterial Ig-like domain (group 3)/FG-GAP-like repeat/S-layer homology domain/FG-GAP repeat